MVIERFFFCTKMNSSQPEPAQTPTPEPAQTMEITFAPEGPTPTEPQQPQTPQDPTEPKKQVKGHFTDICLGEELIDYKKSDHRDKVLERDPLLVPGQELVLVSYIEDEAGTILVHGCFQTDKQATKHLAELNKEREEAGLPLPKWTCTFKTGYWVTWPPKQEFFNKVRTMHPTTSGMSHTDEERPAKASSVDVLEGVDNVMRGFFAAKARQKKEFVVNIAKQAGKEFDDVENLLSPEEYEQLKRVHV